jgi:isocitrate dehydrogenase (NAD+)
MAHRVTLIAGDGIGPEVTQATRRVIEAAGVSIAWDECEAGEAVYQRDGEALPPATVESIRRNRVALKGPIATPSGTGYRSVNVRLRQMLDLFANVRPARSIAGLPARYDNVDLIVVRENTEGLYSGLEHEVVPGVVESLRVITRQASQRVVRFAFEIAQRHGRKLVTAVHKANILKKSDGLFLNVAREVAAEFPQIKYNECIVDAAAMKLVMDPHQFDVLVMENLFGDILSDLTSGLVGGLGLTPSANIGDRFAVFEAVHGTAPDIARQGFANPTAVLLSGVLLLRHVGEITAADRIENAVRQVLSQGRHTTRDLGGTATTDQYVDAVIAALG